MQHILKIKFLRPLLQYSEPHSLEITVLIDKLNTTAIDSKSAIKSKCNRKILFRLGAITPLVGYMAEGNAEVHRTTALALYYLSKNPFNCITMHESGVVPFLLKTVASTDEKLQDASAGCLGNIRRLALEAETYHLITRGEKKEESSDDED